MVLDKKNSIHIQYLYNWLKNKMTNFRRAGRRVGLKRCYSCQLFVIWIFRYGELIIQIYFMYLWLFEQRVWHVQSLKFKKLVRCWNWKNNQYYCVIVRTFRFEFCVHDYLHIATYSTFRDIRVRKYSRYMSMIWDTDYGRPMMPFFHWNHKLLGLGR